MQSCSVGPDCSNLVHDKLSFEATYPFSLTMKVDVIEGWSETVCIKCVKNSQEITSEVQFVQKADCTQVLYSLIQNSITIEYDSQAVNS